MWSKSTIISTIKCNTWVNLLCLIPSLVPGMSGNQIQIIIGVQEGHIVLLNAAVHHVHQTGSGNSFDLHPKTLHTGITLPNVQPGFQDVSFFFCSSDLYEDGSGHWGGFWHHHLALWPVMFGGIRERLPIVPGWHGDKMTTPRSSGELIGHSPDFKWPCGLSVTQPFNGWSLSRRWHGAVMCSRTSPLHVLQFKVDVTLDAQRKGCLGPGDHGSVDDTQGAASHRLPDLPQ